MLTFRTASADLTASDKFSEFKRGLKISIPLLLAIIPFALVLGAQAAQKGFSALEVPLLTGLNFAGGSEFAILDGLDQSAQYHHADIHYFFSQQPAFADGRQPGALFTPLAQ